MVKHFLEKWDCYLAIGLGVVLILAARYQNEIVLKVLNYYVFVMIGVVVFDTIKNFREHENLFWKVAAIASNGAVLISCIIILEMVFGYQLPVMLAGIIPFSSMPNFLIYLGAFLVIENMMWTYVYEHF